METVLHRRLAHEHRLEAPGKGGVLFHVLPVFIERGSTHAMQFAARQSRLQQVGGIHGPFRLARPHQRVHFVDEQDDAAGRRLDLGEHRLETLLELATILRPGNERAHVEGHQALVLEAFGHIAIDDPQRQAFGNCRLADTRLADQHGVVLGAPRQDLNGAADFVVAPDYRIELAFARRLGEVAGVFLQRIVALLGRSRVSGAALAQFVDRLVQAHRSDATILQHRCRIAFFNGQCLQQPLGGHKAVAGLPGDLAGGLEDPRRLRRQIELAGPAAFHLGQLLQVGLDGGQHAARIAARRLDQAGRQPLLVVDENFQDVIGNEALMAFPQSQILGRLNETARPLGEFFEVHMSSSARFFGDPRVRHRRPAPRDRLPLPDTASTVATTIA
jgi:hypothetical protein